MRAAILQWARGRLGRAFGWWWDHTSRKVLRHRKGRAYLALLLGRAAAFAMYMLHANAKRKRRTRGARLHRRRATLRRALYGWRFRIAMGAKMEESLIGVFRKVKSQVLILSLVAV